MVNKTTRVGRKGRRGKRSLDREKSNGISDKDNDNNNTYAESDGVFRKIKSNGKSLQLLKTNNGLVIVTVIILTIYQVAMTFMSTSNIIASIDDKHNSNSDRNHSLHYDYSEVGEDHLGSSNVNNPLTSLMDAALSILQENHHLTSSTITSPGQSQQSQPKATIAYAISLIKCGDFQSSTEGLSDAAIILRHSIHMTSIRNPVSGSKYDYKMYAIVHEQAAGCSQSLSDAGFEVVVKAPPVKQEEIQGEFLRKTIHREWCCGHDEFIKLYAYTNIPAPIVVHLDVDMVMVKPMDDLFDVMLDDNDQAAKARIPLERPDNPWPLEGGVEVFMTRDWPQVMPGRIPGFQAGFIVLKPNQQVFDEIIDIVKQGDYVDGYSRQNGWGGKGYGGYVGAMAMQGLLAYYYDHFRNKNWVELNQCRFNHMGLDVRYRSHPAFNPNHHKVGQCRNDLEHCEDCMTTSMDQIYNIHYTYCRKPWNCIGETPETAPNKKLAVISPAVTLEHCMDIMKIWHGYRTDLETKLSNLTGDQSIVTSGTIGQYKKEIFQGHCNANNEYVSLKGNPESIKRIPELYH